MPSLGSVVPEPYRVPTFCAAGGGGLAGGPGAPLTSAGAPAGMRHKLPLKALAPADGSSPRYIVPSGASVGEKPNEYWRGGAAGDKPEFEEEGWGAGVLVLGA